MGKHALENKLVHFNTAKERVLMQLLIVLVQQNLRLVHGRKAEGRDASLTKEAAIGSRRKHFGFNSHSKFLIQTNERVSDQTQTFQASQALPRTRT